MLKIYYSEGFESEKEYIIDTIFGEFLKLDYQISREKVAKGFKIVLENGGVILFPVDFLYSNLTPPLDLAERSSFQSNIFSIESDIPIIYGADILSYTNEKIVCHNDIFSTSFFLLTRLEEYYSNEFDAHQRFKGCNSILYKLGVLHRPIVDEYTEMLWQMITYLQPSIQRPLTKPTKMISCDVDWPFDPRPASFYRSLKSSIFSFFYKKNYLYAFKIMFRYFVNLFYSTNSDEYYDRLYWMMDVNEKHGNKLTFFFIVKNTSTYEKVLDLESNRFKSLLLSIHRRGHYIGIHPGYNCYDNENNYVSSCRVLEEIMDSLNINQNIFGSRMHYLRFNIEITPIIAEKLVDYDSSLAFSEISGFRCGTCKEFSMFSVLERRKLDLRQVPLTNMECTVINKGSEELGYSLDSFNKFLYYKEIVEKYRGTYGLLWHNSSFSHKSDETFYLELIK